MGGHVESTGNKINEHTGWTGSLMGRKNVENRRLDRRTILKVDLKYCVRLWTEFIF